MADEHIAYYINPQFWWETVETPCTCSIGEDHG